MTFAGAGVVLGVALTATEAERERRGALSREVLRAGVTGATCLACVIALEVAVTEVLIEVRLVGGARNPGGLAGVAGLMAEVCVFGGDASVSPWLRSTIVACAVTCYLLRCMRGIGMQTG